MYTQVTCFKIKKKKKLLITLESSVGGANWNIQKCTNLEGQLGVVRDTQEIVLQSG